MNQSEHDPTLRDHFSEDEARQWIRHLERVAETQENKKKIACEKNKQLAEKNTYLSRKCRRLEASVEYLQQHIRQLLAFIRANGLTPPENLQENEPQSK